MVSCYCDSLCMEGKGSCGRVNADFWCRGQDR